MQAHRRRADNIAMASFLEGGDHSIGWHPSESSGAAGDRSGDLVPSASGWGFLICAAVAVGYGLWGLYGSGSRVVVLDVTAIPAGVVTSPSTGPPVSDQATPGPRDNSLGPLTLTPEMNPLRAVLRATYAPIGSTRRRYDIAFLDAAGREIWQTQAVLGNKDDEASIVRTTTSLRVFDLAKPGDYFVRARFPDGGMDALRGATLELRWNVIRVDTRVTWGFGLGAVACLVVNLIASRRRPWPYRPVEDQRQPAV